MRCDIESLIIRVRKSYLALFIWNWGRILASFAAILCGIFGASAGLANKELTLIAGFVWTILIVCISKIHIRIGVNF